MRLLLLSICLVFALHTKAQESTGGIVGKVIDKELNDEPLPFANVLIKNSTKGTTSDFDGLYEINNITPGTYTLAFSYLGYETVEVPDVIIAPGKITSLNIPMRANQGVTLDEVVVTVSAKKDTETALLLDQKKAVEMKTSIGAQELARKGVSDAAGAVAQISGISKQEGSNNVYVRGLGDRYLSTTMNGLSLPSNNINNKNIDLNLFSSDIIESVGVSKAYSSKFYADFSAGNVDISSKEYTGTGFFDASVSTGVNSRAAGEDFVKNEGTGYFGFYNRYDHNPFAVILSHGVDPVENNKIAPVNTGIALSFGKSYRLFGEDSESLLSFFGHVSFDSKYRYLEGSQANYGTNLDVLFPSVERYTQSTTSTALANVTFKINNNNKLKFNSLAINSSGDEVGYYGTNGEGFSQDLNSDVGYFQLNSQFNQDLIFVNQLTGEHTFDEKLNLQYGVGYNRVFAYEPDRKRITLNNYDLLFDNDPATSPDFGQQNNFNNQRYFQNIEDEEFNSRINISYQVSPVTKLNFGYNGRTKERSFDNQRYGYKNISNSFNITDVNDLNTIFNLDNFVLGLGNEGEGYQTHVFRPLDPENTGLTQTSAPGELENTYTGKLDVYAGYVSAEFNLNDKWLLIPGVRIESFNQRIAYDVINLRPDLNPGSNEVNESIYLPNLNIKYTVNEDQNIRLSGSQTVSFPEFKEMAPFVYEGVTQRIGGNPDVLGRQNIATINYNNVEDVSYSNILNLDLKYEWFFSRNEILSIGGFAKQIQDPINLVVANDATGTQRYFRTGKKADVFGAELELRKNILLNDEQQPELTFGLNVSYIHTKQDLYSEISGSYSTTFNRDSDELQGSSPLIANADLNWSPTFGNYSPVINLVGNYFSDRIFALGSGQLGNIIEKGIPTLDLVWKNTFGDHLEVNLNAKNILDPTFEINREITNGQNIILQDFKRGVDLGLSIKYSF
ncbi:TonB-dependent receptor [Sediminicola sp. YIK13]|uniref:TonB-dependent receptor n=1 Tax=Sediminicola sp. YIK13 TaxID=1453352 RepID=UPI00071FA1ED|nr:TonB-dependent receptor [Sediminicola sp. YIK13]ALM08770.1 TonB-dependent receptor [Sediminicola sp. YIK13]